ncbi:MAG: tRNA (adenosine(37)-N6)-threonylcarbamoyltransferase complex dimerization subunit type 1 TsaB [Lachnospiraceae bacterium]|nr:tRNA (adenosine(37)-N6)-threonylcarbamoyltransferase complex dimerization subunit type 1 TsaB [Lachnospiraceae bacterium]
MKILAVDSSGNTASVAVYIDGVITALNSVNNNKTHSQTLLPMIEHAMKQSDMTVSQLDAVAAAEGPGSFTGLRIGASTVKGLSFAAGIPVIPVSTLAALAYNFAGMGGIICPVMDARRGQVYSAVYSFCGDCGDVIHEIYGPRAIALDDVLRLLCEKHPDERILFLGDGVLVHESRIREVMKEKAYIALSHQRFQSAASVAMLAARLYEDGKYVDGAEFEPVYLRLSQAERERIEKGCGK